MEHEPATAERDALPELLTMALRRRRTLLVPPLVLAVVVGVAGLLLPRDYTSRVSFVPSAQGSGGSRLAGIAAQFGVSVGGDDPSQSADFYADFLTSSSVLRRLAVMPVLVSQHGDTLRESLLEFLEAPGSTEARRIENAAKMLKGAMNVSTNFKTSVVGVSVTTTDPWVSEQVVDSAVALINAFNLHRRQSQATLERIFTQERAEEAERELRLAEDRMQGFLQRNRSFEGAPALKFEHDRLDRDVQLRSDIYRSLVQGLEQSRIDEVRNVPVITVVEAAIIPPRPDSRKLVLKVILAALLGLLIGGCGVLLGEYAVGAGNSGEREALRTEWERAKGDLGRMWRRVRGGSSTT